MPKSLGQIHTVDFTHSPVLLAPGSRLLCDTSRGLTEQLQTMVRWGSIFKCVGIDMAVSSAAAGGGVSVSGQLRYYAPTRGRVAACKEGFKAVKRGMKLQGINIRGNRQYDFRAPLAPSHTYLSIQPGAGTYGTEATIDGSGALAMSHTTADRGLFEVYNSNISPEAIGAPSFSSGFGLPGTTDSEDFVLNPAAMYEAGMTRSAQTQMESIPFQMTYDPNGSDPVVSPTFEWRPDPALYLAILTGQVEIIIDEVYYYNGATQAHIDISLHISGWKNVLGDGRRGRRSSSQKKSSSKKKSGGKK